MLILEIQLEFFSPFSSDTVDLLCKKHSIKKTLKLLAETTANFLDDFLL